MHKAYSKRGLEAALESLNLGHHLLGHQIHTAKHLTALVSPQCYQGGVEHSYFPISVTQN